MVHWQNFSYTDKWYYTTTVYNDKINLTVTSNFIHWQYPLTKFILHWPVIFYTDNIHWPNSLTFHSFCLYCRKLSKFNLTKHRTCFKNWINHLYNVFFTPKIIRTCNLSQLCLFCSVRCYVPWNTSDFVRQPNVLEKKTKHRRKWIAVQGHIFCFLLGKDYGKCMHKKGSKITWCQLINLVSEYYKLLAQK